MPFNPNEEKAMTLIEVMAALVVLSLLAVTLLSLFSTSGFWITGGAKRTQASDYATAIIETVKAYSSDLHQANLLESRIDANVADEKFTFSLDPAKSAVEVKAPPGMTAELQLSQHEDKKYYDQDDNNIEDFSRYIKNNLFDVSVTITWDEAGHSRQFQMFSVVSAR